MKVAEQIFHIFDVGCDIIVEIVNKQKDILNYIDEYLYNLQFDWFDPTDENFMILYKDGSYDRLDSFHDGHHIKRNNILSVVYDDPCTSIVYGNFIINKYGVVTPSFQTLIDDNIQMVTERRYNI